jgi:hypothetical protein
VLLSRFMLDPIWWLFVLAADLPARAVSSSIKHYAFAWVPHCRHRQPGRRFSSPPDNRRANCEPGPKSASAAIMMPALLLSAC